MAAEDKPECQLTESDGNVFAIIGYVCRTLKRADLRDQADEFRTKAVAARSYEQVLRLCFDYVSEMDQEAAQGGKMNTPTDPRVITAVTADLRAFGYSNLTEAQVKTEIEDALAGKEPGIIGMFAVDMLKKAGLWPGEQPKNAGG